MFLKVDPDRYTEAANSTQSRRYFASRHVLADKKIEGAGAETATSPAGCAEPLTVKPRSGTMRPYSVATAPDKSPRRL
ncbi:MAG: hypothetical protein ACMG6S_27795 [Byssovorax sp.]